MFKLRLFSKIAAVLRLAEDKPSINMDEDFLGNINPGRNRKKVKLESTEHFPALDPKLVRATFENALDPKRLKPLLVKALNQYFLLETPLNFLRGLDLKLKQLPDPKVYAILKKWEDSREALPIKHVVYRINLERALFGQLSRLRNFNFEDESTRELVSNNLRLLEKNLGPNPTFKKYRESKNSKLSNIVGKLVNQFILAFPNRSRQILQSNIGLDSSDLDILANYLAGHALSGIDGNYRNKLIKDTARKFDTSLRGILGSPGRMKALGSPKSGEDIVNDALQDVSEALVSESYRLLGIRKDDLSPGQLPSLPWLGAETSLVQHINYILKNRMRNVIQPLKKENVHDEKEAKRKLLDHMESRDISVMDLDEAEKTFGKSRDPILRSIPVLLKRYFPLSVGKAREIYQTDSSTYSLRVLDPSVDILQETDAYRADEVHHWEERIPAAISGLEKMQELEKVGHDFRVLLREMEQKSKAAAGSTDEKLILNEVQQLKAMLDTLAAKVGDRALFREADTHFRALTKMWRSQKKKGLDVRETGTNIQQVFEFLKSNKGLYGEISDEYNTMYSRFKEGKLAEFIAESVGGREADLFESKLFKQSLPVLISKYKAKKQELLSGMRGETGTKKRQEIQRRIVGPAFEGLEKSVKEQVKNPQGQGDLEDEDSPEAAKPKSKSPSKKKAPVKTSSRERSGSLWIHKLYRDFLRDL